MGRSILVGAVALFGALGCTPAPRTAHQAILASLWSESRPDRVEIVTGPRTEEDGRIFRAVTRDDGTFVLACDSDEDLVCGDDVVGRLLSKDGQDYAPEGCRYVTYWSCEDVDWEPPARREAPPARAPWGGFRYFF